MSDYDAGTIVPRYAPRPKPTPIPEASAFDLPRKCISVNELWVSHILGVMEALDQFDTWIGTPEEVQAARDEVNEIMASWSDDCDPCVTPTGDPPFRNNGFGFTEQLDNGAWVEPFGDYAFPAVPARPELTADERRCLAARNAVEVLAELYEAMTDQYAEEIDPALGLVAILIAAGAIFAFPFAPILGGILLLAELPFSIFYFGVGELGSDLWNTEFSESLTCVFLRHATDDAGVVHFDLPAIITDIGMGIDLFSPEGLDLRLYGQVNFLLRSVGSQGLDHAGTTTSISEYDCSGCAAQWCYRFEDGSGLSAWTPELWNGVCDSGNSYSAGAWQSGSAWQTPSCTGIRVEYVRITREFDPPIQLFDIAAYTEPVVASRSIYANGTSALFSGTILWSNGSYVGGDTEPITRLDVITLRELNDPTPFTLTGVQMSGYGENPFGEDNCDDE